MRLWEAAGGVEPVGKPAAEDAALVRLDRPRVGMLIASALIRAKAGTAILAKITNSAQTTTKLGGVIERVN